MSDERLRFEQCEERRLRVLRGDAVIGIMPVEEIDQMVEIYRQLGEAGMPEAWVGLARYHLDDNGVHASSSDAAECACRAVMLGSKEAQALLRGIVPRLRSEGEEDPNHAKAAFEALDAERTKGANGELLHLIALLKFHGFGTERDLLASLKLHEEAAAQGDRDSMFELYAMLSTGTGAPKDVPAAVKWCIQAAELGQPRAAYNLGAFYATGNGVPKDETRALHWYEQASNAGNGRATATLAYMIMVGSGCAPDPQRAEALFERAADQGFDVEGFREQVGV